MLHHVLSLSFQSLRSCQSSNLPFIALIFQNISVPKILDSLKMLGSFETSIYLLWFQKAKRNRDTTNGLCKKSPKNEAHVQTKTVPVPVPLIQDSMLGHSASAPCKNAAAKNKNVTFAVAAAIASAGKSGFSQDGRKYFRSMFACVLTVSITTSFWLFHLHFSS